MSTVWTLESAREFAEDRGFALLDDEWRGTKVTYTLRCSEGHETQKWWHTLKRGSACKLCNNVKLSQPRTRGLKRRRLDYAPTLARLLCDGYVLHPGAEKHPQKSLPFTCPRNHTGSMMLSTLHRGAKCRQCASEDTAEKNATPYHKVEAVCASVGFRLLRRWSGTHGPRLALVCRAGHEFEIQWSHLRQGNGCRECRYKRQSGPGNHFWKEDRADVSRRRKFRGAMYAMLRNLRLKTETEKAGSSHKVLGYTATELETRLALSPAWDELKSRGRDLHVDHIFPIMAFLNYGIHDPAIICALDNLQPLTRRENSAKCDDYDPDAFEAYLSARGVAFTRPTPLEPS